VTCIGIEHNETSEQFGSHTTIGAQQDIVVVRQVFRWKDIEAGL